MIYSNTELIKDDTGFVLIHIPILKWMRYKGSKTARYTMSLWSGYRQRITLLSSLISYGIGKQRQESGFSRLSNL